MSDIKETHIAGDRVCVRTTYGWEIEGELQLSDSQGVRVFDPVIDEVVRLGHDEIVEVADAGDGPASSEKRG